MGKGRLEAFSDGVIAIIITIMVLEVKVPHGADWAALRPLGPVFASYLLSFTIIGIYWNGHHHMLHVAKRVDARMMWMNLHFLFWLSLIPVVTAWVGENVREPVPTALYGAAFLLTALAFNALQAAIRRGHADDAAIVAVLGRRTKGTISELMYVAAIAFAFVEPFVSDALYVGVAALWFIPDRAQEQAASKHHD